MEKDEIIDITNKLYKISLFFPKKEPLRYRIREIADRIVENLINLELFHNPDINRDDFLDYLYEIEKDLELMNTYFGIIKWQNWVSYFDILDIEEKYDRIKDNLLEYKEKAEELSKQTSLLNKQPISARQPTRKTESVLDVRKEKILNILRERGKIQVGEVKEIMPNVSKRTLRRDFEYLFKKDFVQRIGQGNNTFYTLKND